MNQVYRKSVQEKTFIDRQYEDFDRFISENNKIELLFLGDSHTLNAINPQYFDKKTYNFGTPAENYFKTYLKLEYIVSKADVDVIVLEIDPHSFNSYYSQSEILKSNLNYYFYKSKNYQQSKFVEEESYTSIWLKSEFPWLGKGTDFFDFYDVNELTPIYDGWKNVSGDFSETNRELQTRKTFDQFFKNKEPVDAFAVLSFQKIIELAQKKDIKVILIKYPITDDLLEKINEQNSLENYYRTISTFSNATIFDYQTNFTKKYDLFEDAHHLNHKGANLLSKQLNTDFLALK